jgi:hypothetical protein
LNIGHSRMKYTWQKNIILNSAVFPVIQHSLDQNYLDNLDFIAVQYGMNSYNYNFQFLGFHHLYSFSSIFEILVLFKYILWSCFHFLKYVSLPEYQLGEALCYSLEVLFIDSSLNNWYPDGVWHHLECQKGDGLLAFRV